METKTWKLYHRDREYARQCGDPVLQEVLAETRFDAEQRWNGLSPVGVIAVEATGSGLEPLPAAEISQFILESKLGISTGDGYYYHYNDVIQLISDFIKKKERRMPGCNAEADED